MSRVTREFLSLYEEELEFLRESATLFAHDHPAFADSLGIDQASDPSVERLLEGVAFLSARVRLKLATSERQVATELLGAMVPLLVQPVPSAAILALQMEDAALGQLSAPIVTARGTVIRAASASVRGQCTFRTVQDLTLHPWRHQATQFLGSAGMVALQVMLPESLRSARAALKLSFEVGKQAQASGFALNELSLHFGGDNAAASSRLLRALLSDAVGIAVTAEGRLLGAGAGSHLFDIPGFDEGESLFDRGPTQYSGHRILAEWFALPERFQFLRSRLDSKAAVRIQGVEKVEFHILLATDPARLAEDVARVDVSVNAVPVVNEYPVRLDRVLWNPTQTECQLIVDRMQPFAHEVLEVREVAVYQVGGATAQARSVLDPAHDAATAPFAYHVMRRLRAPWRHAATAGKAGLGSEPMSTVHLSMVCPETPEAIVSVDQIGVTALVCDGDRPQRMWRTGNVRWQVEASGGLKVSVKVAPTQCTRRHLTGTDNWGLVSSLRQSLETFGRLEPKVLGERLREVASRFVLDGSARGKRVVESIRAVTSRSAVRPVPGGGPLAYCRGIVLSIETHVEDVDAAQMFLFSVILDRFIAGHCSVNGFTQLGVRTPLSEVSWEWPPRRGATELL